MSTHRRYLSAGTANTRSKISAVLNFDALPTRGGVRRLQLAAVKVNNGNPALRTFAEALLQHPRSQRKSLSIRNSTKNAPSKINMSSIQPQKGRICPSMVKLVMWQAIHRHSAMR